MSPEKLRQEGAKLYLTDIHCFATVARVSEEVITLNTGSKKEPRYNRYEVYEFDAMVKKGTIVGKSQVIFNDKGDFVGVKGQEVEVTLPQQPVAPAHPISEKTNELTTVPPYLTETAYINEKTGKFSREKKRGYTQIKFSKVKQKITLELDEEKIEELKKLGVL